MIPSEALRKRAEALHLHGLLAHWSELAECAWVEPLLTWEETERARRSLERRLADAHIGRCKPLADFDWDWPQQCDRTAISELMSLEFLKSASNAILVNRRHECRSTLITTNRSFSEWPEVSPNAACTVALIDRLVHHAEIVAIKGESYRRKEAQERTEQRARKRRSAAGAAP